jgi:PAS domain S-box-containing protein
MSKMSNDKNGNLTAVEQLQQKPTESLIVAIGASSGGTKALQDFVRNIPETSFLIYIVISHFSVESEPEIKDILEKESKIPVILVSEKTIFKPDHIYIVPNNQHIFIDKESVSISQSQYIEEKRAPIDVFFRNLADQHGPRAICVILSGTGANGSMGLKRIKERGGATYVQDPKEAEFNEMPLNAIATELIDEVLKVAQIPGHIISYRNSVRTVEIAENPTDPSESQQQALKEIFLNLRTRTGHDFTNYKRPTLLRRIERRINVHNLTDLPSYAALLNKKSNETRALLKDLLISVTNFFRDKKAFTWLEQEIIPSLFAGKTSQDHIRIWVAGCATGEEAYSIAILCAEQLTIRLDAPKIQIFATDIDESAIATAREGSYTINDAADVSTERLRRFFTPDGNNFKVRKEIREMILFANHNFLKDPPFSKLDLVTCRNVLIYLNATAQKRAISTFHFALGPKKYLFLGTSESVDAATDLYEVYNREHHVFKSKEVLLSSYPVPESGTTPYFGRNEPLTIVSDSQSPEVPFSIENLHQKVLEKYMPASVIINKDYEIIDMSEKAGRFFEFSKGKPTQNLLKLINSQLRLELRAGLYQSIHNNTPVEVHNLKLTLNGQQQLVSVHISPINNQGEQAQGLIHVVFNVSEDINLDTYPLIVSSDAPARHLEEELIGVKTQLRKSIEFHEYQSEELTASNEELQAMNEEMRLAAEELETSKEELQSINEEMRTVNQELKVKVEETNVTSNNLQNLINSANVGTIFLDTNFAIRLFTPAILEIFNLKIADYGRPITDITNNLDYKDLMSDATLVLEKLTMIEREVTTADHKFYMMQILPYRTSDNRIDGVVLTFFDITTRKQTEQALRDSEVNYRKQLENKVELRTLELQRSKHQYSSLVENTPDVLTRWNTNLELIFANAAFSNMADEISMQLGKSNIALNQSGKFAVPDTKSLTQAFSSAETVEYYSSIATANGEIYYHSRLTPEIDKNGNVQTVLSTARDITDMKLAEIKIKESRDLLQSILDNSFIAMSVLSPVYDESNNIIDFRIKLVNKKLAFETGRDDLIGKLYSQEYPGIKSTGLFDIMLRVLETGTAEGIEYYYPYDGFDNWFSCIFVKMEDGLVATNMDISIRKKAEEHLRKSEERLRMFVSASSDLIYQMSPDFSKMEVLDGDSLTLKTEAIADQWMSRYIPLQEWKKVSTTLEQALKNKQVLELEHRILLSEGKTGWASSRAIPVFGEDNEILEWFGIATDITSRKVLEAERNKNYLLLYQSEMVVRAGTWDYEIDTKVVNWSEGMYRLFNIDKQKSIGPEIYLQYAIKECKDTALKISNNIKNGDSEFEEKLTLKIGNESKVLKVKGTVFKDEQGQPVRVLGVDMDVTESEQSQEKVRQMEAEQQMEIFKVTVNTQEEERRRISESLHNGLGQLLFSIKISIDELSSELAKENEKAYANSKMYSESLLSSAIKECRRISHELMPLLLEDFGLETAVKDICTQVKEAVKFNCKVNLKGKKLSKFFELAVYRTVQELVLNTVKHADATTGEISIDLDGNGITIEVTDNGKGFKQIKQPEAGIGLASIRNKATALGGSVDINSVPGKGTKIKVYLEINATLGE